MKISARNSLTGKIQKVTKGAVNAEVQLALEGGETVVAIIINSSVDLLGLAAGKEAFAIIKASEVMIGKNLEGAKLSARDVLAAEISRVMDCSVNNEIVVRMPDGTEIVASLTKEGV